MMRAENTVAAMGSAQPTRLARTGPMRSTPHRKAVKATAVPSTTVIVMARMTSGVHVIE